MDRPKRAPKLLFKDIDRLFILSYLSNLNKSQAARDVTKRKLTDKAAGDLGVRLYNKPQVKGYIESILQKAEESTIVTASRVLKEIERLALVDVGQAFSSNGQLKELASMDENVRRAIASVEVETLWEGRGESREAIGTLHKVRFWDKPKGLEMLSKYLRLWVDAASGAASGRANDPVHTVQKVDLSWADEKTLRRLAEGK